VEDGFFSKLQQLEALIHQTKSNIALMGVKPTHPSEKYGYIVPRTRESLTEQEKPYLNVSHFIEKPREDKAKELMKLEALWNCGVFAFKLDYLINLLIESGYPIQFSEMLKQYHR